MATMLRFAVLTIDYTHIENGFKIVITSDVPCHLWMRSSLQRPHIHKKPVLRRGLRIADDVRFCFTVFEDNEQEEPGDTYVHTFLKSDWPVCQTRYFYFHGNITDTASPSTTAIFTKHRSTPPFPTIFYPDAHPEVTSVDGYVGIEAPFKTWPQIQGGAGDVSYDNLAHLLVWLRVSGAAPPNNYYHLYRSILLFDLSIALGRSVASAALLLHGTKKVDNEPIFPSINVFSSGPASNIALAPADYTTLGTTPLATPLQFGEFSAVSWNALIFNATGRALIDAALAGDGIVKLGLREATFDAPDVEPFPGLRSRIIQFEMYSADNIVVRKPYLQVTWA